MFRAMKLQRSCKVSVDNCMSQYRSMEYQYNQSLCDKLLRILER